MKKLVVMKRQELISTLKQGKTEVVFTKADGTSREMLCTLQAELLPTIEETTTPKKKRAVNESQLRVYDLEKEAWRSFTIASVQSIKRV